MATSLLPPDFKEFLRLLNSHQIEYLLIGGYAVGYHGYARATADMDIWVAAHPQNAAKMIELLREFGFGAAEISLALFLEKERIIRMGVPPFRIEVLTSISGVDFDECFAGRIVDVIDGVEVNIISLPHLKANKKASGRLKDLADVQHLP